MVMEWKEKKRRSWYEVSLSYRTRARKAIEAL